MSEATESVLDLKTVEAQLEKTFDKIDAYQKKASKEIEDVGHVSTETKNAVEKLAEKSVEIGDRLQALEQSQAEHFDGAVEQKTAGQMLVESDDFARFQQTMRGHVEVKTAIVNAVPSLEQPLTPGHRLDRVVHEPHRNLRIRDVLPVGRTDSNIVWFPKENAFTNNAKVQVGTASPIIVAENVAHGESALTFTSDSEEVKTIGHFIPVSLNALSDSSFLRSYVDYKLMYGLKFKEETELLTGSGLVGTIEGIYTGRTAYTVDSPVSYTTKLDILRDAIGQLEVANYGSMVDFIVLNPADMADIELTKETGGLYVYANPANSVAPRLWGKPVVISNSMTAGTFLVGCSSAAQIWDRQDAAVSISYEDSTNFQKDMATLKAVERLALTIYNKAGFVGGSFTVT